MKLKKLIVSTVCYFALLIGFTAPITSCAAGGGLTPTASADIQNALLTVDNVAQELNTGLQTAAPSLETILTMTHNQGDATAVNNIVGESAAATPAITTLLGALNTAIQSSTTPAAQIAAVNAALSPATAAAIVAPIQAAEIVAPVAPPALTNAMYGPTCPFSVATTGN